MRSCAKLGYARLFAKYAEMLFNSVQVSGKEGGEVSPYSHRTVTAQSPHNHLYSHRTFASWNSLGISHYVCWIRKFFYFISKDFNNLPLVRNLSVFQEVTVR